VKAQGCRPERQLAALRSTRKTGPSGRIATRIHRSLAALALLACPFLLSGCLPAVAARELTYRPSPSDPYRIWRAYITDSGLLFLCASVDNDREGMERVDRVYNLEFRLDETLLPLRSDAIQNVRIDDHPVLHSI